MCVVCVCNGGERCMAIQILFLHSGGGFGGKETQNIFLSTAVAVAANK